MNEIQLYNYIIGGSYQSFIIMDACVNHNGDINTAKQLALEAKNNGANAIKYQLHLPDKEMLKDVPHSSNFDEPLYDFLKRVSLSPTDHKNIKDYCDKIDIHYMCTPFSLEAVDILEKLNLEVYKIGSGEMMNTPLLERIIETGRPMIISTGMSEISEIHDTVAYLKSKRVKFVLMNCTSLYPTPYESVNLNIIPYLKTMFRVPIGHSDHTIGIHTSIAAVAMGAKVIEKHFTLDKTQPGPDQIVSIEPQELKIMVKQIRDIESGLYGEKYVLPNEVEIRKWAQESIVSITNILPDTVITRDMISMKRPGTGILSKHMKHVIGRTTRKPITTDKIIQWSDLY